MYESKDVYACIYDENFSKVKTFKMRRDQYVSYQEKERARIAVLLNTKISSDDAVYPWTGYKDWVEGADSVYTTEDGAKFYVMEFFDEWEYGKKYPAIAWRRMHEDKYDEEILRYVEFEYEEKYDGEWEITENTNYIEPFAISLRELNNNPYGETYNEDGLSCTQTLFNSDEKYEYAFPKYSFTEGKYEEDRDGDGDVDYIHSYWYAKYDGFDVISEDGNIVLSYTFDQAASTDKDEAYFDIYIWGEKTYICIDSYDDTNNMWLNEFYSFDRNTSQITRVADNNALMRMIPAMPRKNTSVTVELSEESVKEGGQLIVTDMNGRKVHSTIVGVNQTSVRVPLHRMSSGVYNVTLTNNGERIENSKLIIQ